MIRVLKHAQTAWWRGYRSRTRKKGKESEFARKKLFVREHLDRHAYQVMSNRLVTKGLFVVEILSGEVRSPHYIIYIS